MEINMSKAQDDKLKIQQQLTLHQTLADKSYDSKAKGCNASKNDPSMKTITFDVQQSIPTPHLLYVSVKDSYGYSVSQYMTMMMARAIVLCGTKQLQLRVG